MKTKTVNPVRVYVKMFLRDCFFIENMNSESGNIKNNTPPKKYKRHQYAVPFDKSLLEKNNLEILTYLKEKTILFDDVPDELVEQLVPLSRIQDYKQGDVILKENSPNDRVFFLMRGAIGVYKEGDYVLRLQRKGDVFGEMSLITDKTCSATVIAENEVTVFCIQLKKIAEKTNIDTKLIKDTLYKFYAVILADKLALTTTKAIGLSRKVKERTEALKNKNEELKIAIDTAEEANRLKSEFLINMSHELRTPMHGILSYSKFGIDNLKEINKEKILYYFTQIKTAGERLMNLINNLLDLSKLGERRDEYNMEMIHIVQLVKDAVSDLDPIRKEKNLKVIVAEPTVSTKIICDKLKIDQVIRNLLSNALKFTPPKKQIKIFFETGEISLGKRSTDTDMVPALMVSIMDEGVGIPENELKSVFNIFIQSSKTKTGAGGTGLGLAICNEVIKAHKGQIWAKKNPQKGVTFCFLLPYEQEAKKENNDS